MYPKLGHKVGVLGERKLPHWPSDQRELIIADLTACVEEKGKVDIYQIAALRLSTPKGMGKQVWKAVLAALAQILMIAIVVCDICSKGYMIYHRRTRAGKTFQNFLCNLLDGVSLYFEFYRADDRRGVGEDCDLKDPEIIGCIMIAVLAVVILVLLLVVEAIRKFKAFRNSGLYQHRSHTFVRRSLLNRKGRWCEWFGFWLNHLVFAISLLGSLALLFAGKQELMLKLSTVFWMLELRDWFVEKDDYQYLTMRLDDCQNKPSPNLEW